MRRNPSRGRGRGPSPWSSGGNRGISNDRFRDSDRPVAVPGGPLMTDHLQLHDLDLELALLKRKREIIETQQNILLKEPPSSSFGSSSQYRFDQPRNNYGQQFNQMRKYSDMYDDRPQPQYDRYDRQPSLKRSAPVQVWESDAPPPAKRPGGGRPKPYRPPPPLMGSSFSQSKHHSKDNSNFKPNKVSKPKTSAPNNLQTYPVANRKKLVESASSATTPRSHSEPLVFDARRATSTKLLGRLELALGNILREMRMEFGEKEPHSGTFKSTSGQRLLKQAIRDRIRNIMDGKVVGSCAEVINMYRAKHPKENDLDMLNGIGNFDQRKAIAINIIESDNPEIYFKLNFNRLLNETLGEMFKKLQTLYEKEPLSHKVMTEIYDEILVEAGKSIPLHVVNKKESTVTEVVDDKNKEGDNVTKNTETQDIGKINDSGETAVKEEDPKEGAENTNKDVENATEDETTAKEESTAKDESTVKEESTAKEEEKVPEHEKPSQEVEEPTDDGEKTTKDDQITAQEDKKSDQSGEELTLEARRSIHNHEKEKAAVDRISIDTKEFNAEPIKAKFYNRVIETFLKRLLPSTLPKYKRHIINLIKADPAFVYTRGELVMNANAKIRDAPPGRANPEKQNRPANAGPRFEKLPYYVKIVGRPGLPRKKAMKAFLDSFHPSLIKKHRNMHNILFVAFDMKENFDKILAENGHVIGNIRLEIKVSEKITRNPNAKKNQNKQNNDIAPISAGQDMLLLDESLDNQIDDLLSTIRQEEEKKLEKTIDDEGDVTMKSVEDTPANTDENSAVNENKPAETPAGEANDGAENVNANGEVKNGGGKNENNAEETAEENLDEECKDVVNKDVETVKKEINECKGTPTRSSARLAAVTPSTIKTRRSSKLPE